MSLYSSTIPVQSISTSISYNGARVGSLLSIFLFSELVFARGYFQAVHDRQSSMCRTSDRLLSFPRYAPLGHFSLSAFFVPTELQQRERDSYAKLSHEQPGRHAIGAGLRRNDSVYFLRTCV